MGVAPVEETMTQAFTYSDIADALGDVAATTDIDVYGNQVVVYRADGTTAPFKAAIIQPHGDDPAYGVNEFANGLEVAHYISATDTEAIQAPDLANLRDQCINAGITFPTELLPIAAIIERERGSQKVRLRIRKTDENADGIKTLVVEGETRFVDAAWVAIEATLAEMQPA